MSTILAIDFETANHNRDSACAIGLALVRGRKLVKTDVFLIQPPDSDFVFTHIHNLTWDDVCDSETFGELWPRIDGYFAEADYLAAHNASFDRGVLTECCSRTGVVAPKKSFICTMKLARSQWSIYPTRLPDVCRKLGIDLNHHDAASDAQACARIVIAAQNEGWNPR